MKKIKLLLFSLFFAGIMYATPETDLLHKQVLDISKEFELFVADFQAKGVLISSLNQKNKELAEKTAATILAEFKKFLNQDEEKVTQLLAQINTMPADQQETVADDKQALLELQNGIIILKNLIKSLGA